MVRGEDARAAGGLLRVVQLYYQLMTSFRPGPILDQQALGNGSRAILNLDMQSRKRGMREPELFLPEITPGSDSTLLRLCVFDEASTRVEIHRVRVAHDGPLEILGKVTVRDIYRTSY